MTRSMTQNDDLGQLGLLGSPAPKPYNHRHASENYYDEPSSVSPQLAAPLYFTLPFPQGGSVLPTNPNGGGGHSATAVEARCACGVIHRLPTLTIDEERKLTQEIDALQLELRESKEELLHLNEYALTLERDVRQKEEQSVDMQHQLTTCRNEVVRLQAFEEDYLELQQELVRCRSEMSHSQRAALDAHTQLQSQIMQLKRDLDDAKSQLASNAHPPQQPNVNPSIAAQQYNHAALEILVQQLKEENRRLHAVVRHKDMEIAQLRVPVSIAAPASPPPPLPSHSSRESSDAVAVSSAEKRKLLDVIEALVLAIDAHVQSAAQQQRCDGPALDAAVTRLLAPLQESGLLAARQKKKMAARDAPQLEIQPADLQSRHTHSQSGPTARVSLFHTRGPGGSSTTSSRQPSADARYSTPPPQQPCRSGSAEPPIRHRSLSVNSVAPSSRPPPPHAPHAVPVQLRGRSVSPRAVIGDSATPNEIVNPREALPTHSYPRRSANSSSVSIGENHMVATRSSSRQSRNTNVTSNQNLANAQIADVHRVRAERMQLEAENLSLSLQLYAGGSSVRTLHANTSATQKRRATAFAIPPMLQSRPFK